jgi:hypothetical protein
MSKHRQYIEELNAAKKSALGGPLYSAEQIFTWMDSWGTDKELPPPEPDISCSKI